MLGNISGVSLNNWSAGGSSSISYEIGLLYNINRDTKISLWKTQFDLGYGRTYLQDTEFPNRKSQDRLIINTNYTYKLTKHWGVAALVNFQTQFDTGVQFTDNDTGGLDEKEISYFMAPAYLTPSIGMQYNKGEELSILLAPVAGKMTFVLSDTLSNQGAYGVKEGKKFRSEIGPNIYATYNKEVLKNTVINTTLILFADYKRISEIDVNWKFDLVLKVNEYFNTSFGTQLIYDEDIDVPRDEGGLGPALQARFALSIGINLGI
ncbi:hypothetical protein HNQ88_004760 [Aureibacter tunicatorum]|uniref:DUF3078 domain-containing protein n=1 Tax=Aureibacter tunicatorum TaxID=866807 RepID=A0AAE3XT91_9BACT|nr:hypothetical protein [Aureibacter tunicatorum]